MCTKPKSKIFLANRCIINVINSHRVSMVSGFVPLLADVYLADLLYMSAN